MKSLHPSRPIFFFFYAHHSIEASLSLIHVNNNVILSPALCKHNIVPPCCPVGLVSRLLISEKKIPKKVENGSPSPLPTLLLPHSSLQRCPIHKNMTHSLPSLLHLLTRDSPCTTILLDWPSTTFEHPKLQVFCATQKSLKPTLWAPILASLRLFSPSSIKGVVLITTSSVLLNALRHKLVDIQLFQKLILCNSQALLSLQQGKFFAEGDLYNLFIEFITPAEGDQEHNRLPKITIALTSSFLSKADRIATHTNPKLKLLPILSQLSRVYHIESCWSPVLIDTKSLDVSSLSVAQIRSNLLAMDVNTLFLRNLRALRLFERLVRLETQLSPKAAIALLSQAERHLASEIDMMKTIELCNDLAPVVMASVWQEEMESFHFLFSSLRSQLTSHSPSDPCFITRLVETLVLEEASWRDSTAILAVDEWSFVSPLAQVLSDLLSSEWQITIDTAHEGAGDALYSKDITQDRRENYQSLFAAFFLSYIRDSAQHFRRESNGSPSNRRILVINRRHTTLKGPTLGKVGLVVCIGKIKREHEILTLLDSLHCVSHSGHINGAPSTERSLVRGNFPKMVIITQVRYSASTNRLIARLQDPWEFPIESIGALAELTLNKGDTSMSSFAALQTLLAANDQSIDEEERETLALEAQFPRMPLLEVEGAKSLNFSFSSVPPSSTDPSTQVPLFQCSPGSAHVIVHRWLHSLHSSALGGSSLQKTSHRPLTTDDILQALQIKKENRSVLVSSDLRDVVGQEARFSNQNSFSPSFSSIISGTDKLPLLGFEPHHSAVIWTYADSECRVSESRVPQILAVFPSHSALHGKAFGPLFDVKETNSAVFKPLDRAEPRLQSSPSASSPSSADPSLARKILRRSSFLRSKVIPRLEKSLCALHAVIHLYRSNLIDHRLLPIRTLSRDAQEEGRQGLGPMVLQRVPCETHQSGEGKSSLLHPHHRPRPSHSICFTPNEKSFGSLGASFLSTPTSPDSLHAATTESTPPFTIHISSLSSSPSPSSQSLDSNASSSLTKNISAPSPSKRGFGSPRPAIPSLCELLIDNETDGMDESLVSSLQALIISIAPSNDPLTDFADSISSDPNLLDFLKTITSEHPNPQVPPLPHTRLALISKDSIFPPHRLPHTLPLTDKEHRLLTCTIEKAVPLTLTVAEVRKLRKFHHRLFSLINFSGSATMEQSWQKSVYQYVIAPMMVSSDHVDWKSVLQTESGILAPSPSDRLEKPQSYYNHWKEWIGSLVRFESHPEQCYQVKDVDFEKSPLSPSQVGSPISVREFALKKHGYTILDLEQPLLSVKMVSTKPFNGLMVSSALNSLREAHIGKRKDATSSDLPLEEQNPYKFLHLVPEMVRVHFKAFPHDVVAILGSLISRIESYARIEEVLKEVELPGLSWKELLTTFSPIVSSEETNFELLETFGDCILKLFVSASLSQPGAKCLNNRFGSEVFSHRWISNANLCRLAMQRNLDLYVNLGYAFAGQMMTAVKRSAKEDSEKSEKSLKFEGNSRKLTPLPSVVVSAAQRELHPFSCIISGLSHPDGSVYPKESVGTMTEKTVADFTESLIGAAFLSDSERGVNAILAYLGMPEVSLNPTQLIGPILTEKRGFQISIESRLNYAFVNPDLLMTSLTHESYIELEEIENGESLSALRRRPESFHSLCLVGDALFDYLIFHFTHARLNNSTPGDHTLFKAIGVSGCAQSVMAHSLGLHCILRHSSPSLASHLDHFDRTMSRAPFLLQGVSTSVPFWMYTGLDYPEPLAMALEALIGAVFHDTGKDIERTRIIFEPLLQAFWEKHVIDASNMNWMTQPPTTSIHSNNTLHSLFAFHPKKTSKLESIEDRPLASFWPKALLSSLQQHLPTRNHCRAYKEMAPKRLFFCKGAYLVRSTYHTKSVIGVGQSKRSAQNHSSLCMLIALLHGQVAENPMQEEPSLDLSSRQVYRNDLIQAMEEICECHISHPSQKNKVNKQ